MQQTEGSVKQLESFLPGSKTELRKPHQSH